eukprot:scaffold1883_cov108-Isochrysis_galbana.AAC.3
MDRYAAATTAHHCPAAFLSFYTFLCLVYYTLSVPDLGIGKVASSPPPACWSAAPPRHHHHGNPSFATPPPPTHRQTYCSRCTVHPSYLPYIPSPLLATCVHFGCSSMGGSSMVSGAERTTRFPFRSRATTEPHLSSLRVFDSVGSCCLTAALLRRSQQLTIDQKLATVICDRVPSYV